MVYILKVTQGLCIFNPAGQVAFTGLTRDYYRGKLSVEDLGTGLDKLFECMEVATVTKWAIHKGPERMQDKIGFVMSF